MLSLKWSRKFLKILWNIAKEVNLPNTTVKTVFTNTHGKLKMKHTLFTIAAMAFVVTSSVANLAQADPLGEDLKGYPGSDCLAQSQADDVRRTLNGSVENYQNAATIVYCPVVRDVSDLGNNRVTGVRVYITDNHPADDVWCRLNVLNPDGSLFAWDIEFGAGIGNQILNLGPIDASAFGNYVLSCGLPGAVGFDRSSVRTYALSERL